MEAIKLKGFAKHGTLTIAVPHQFDEKELEVIILSDNQAIISTDKKDQSQKEKIKRLLNVVGTAKYPDAPIDKYDVYDQ